MDASTCRMPVHCLLGQPPGRGGGGGGGVLYLPVDHACGCARPSSTLQSVTQLLWGCPLHMLRQCRPHLMWYVVLTPLGSFQEQRDVHNTDCWHFEVQKPPPPLRLSVCVRVCVWGGGGGLLLHAAGAKPKLPMPDGHGCIISCNLPSTPDNRGNGY